MSLARRIVPGKVWMLTRRTTQRMFLMRPDDDMNNAFLYCLIEAANRFGIVLLLPMMMSNHEHIAFFDPRGASIEFIHRFHTHLARCINALRGRWENALSSEPPCLVELTDRASLVQRLIYTATNPVKDHLVDKVHHWPGPRTVPVFLAGGTITATRPGFLFRDDGPMPETAEASLRIPEQLGDHDALAAEVRTGIAEVEARCASDLAARGGRVLGRKRVRDQSWRACPQTREPRRGLRPRVAGGSRWARIAALQRNRAFLDDYARARERWLRGEPDVVFPAGTWWLRRFAHVTVAPPPPAVPFA